MIPSLSNLDARERVSRAYAPEALAALGRMLVDRLVAHLQSVQSSESDVLNWRDPEENLQQAGNSLLQYPPDPGHGSLTSRFRELIDLALARGHNLHDPRYIGHQVPASLPIAGLFDALGAITNQVMAIYEMGPWATSVEQAVVNAWGEQIGLAKGQFSGLITHGGSLANLTALLTARNVMLAESWERGLQPQAVPPVLVTHADAHYCVTRSAGILGLGTERVLRAPLDERRRMDPGQLDDLLARLRNDDVPVMAVSACACATPIGAFDRLHEIADVCERYGVWLHVDAAHGGAVAFSETHRHLIDGLARADSFICDAHKTLFVPALCACVFYKDRAHRFETFRQEAPYLFDPSAPGMADVDSGLVTIECTKRAAAYGLWGVWSMFGPQLFGDMIDLTFDTARLLYGKLDEAQDFEPLHDPECNIVVFRHVPAQVRESMTAEETGEFNRTIRRRLIESGEFYIVQTNFDGVGALRVCVMNPLTEERHLDQLLDSIRRIGAEFLEG